MGSNDLFLYYLFIIFCKLWLLGYGLFAIRNIMQRELVTVLEFSDLLRVLEYRDEQVRKNVVNLREAQCEKSYEIMM